MALSYFALFVLALFALYQASRVVPTALRPAHQFSSLSQASALPAGSQPHFHTLLFQTPFPAWLGNSLLVAFAITLTGVAIASPAGYAWARWRSPGAGATLSSSLVTQMLPALVLLLPLCLVLVRLGLFQSYLALIIVYAVTGLPFCIWQLKRFYETIPLSLEEAAKIDGCTRWQSFYLVVLPLSYSALLNAALFTFLTAWDEYVVAALLLPGFDHLRLSLGPKMFDSNMSAQWSSYAAGALLLCVPALLLFLFLGRVVSRSRFDTAKG